MSDQTRFCLLVGSESQPSPGLGAGARARAARACQTHHSRAIPVRDAAAGSDLPPWTATLAQPESLGSNPTQGAAAACPRRCLAHGSSSHRPAERLTPQPPSSAPMWRRLPKCGGGEGGAGRRRRRRRLRLKKTSYFLAARRRTSRQTLAFHLGCARVCARTQHKLLIYFTAFLAHKQEA